MTIYSVRRYDNNKTTATAVFILLHLSQKIYYDDKIRDALLRLEVDLHSLQTPGVAQYRGRLWAWQRGLVPFSAGSGSFRSSGLPDWPQAQLVSYKWVLTAGGWCLATWQSRCHLPSFFAEVKNTWRFASIPLHIYHVVLKQTYDFIFRD